jgi:hypothetical protein
MWICTQCGESAEDAFSVCWKCGTSRDGVPDAAFRAEPEPFGTSSAPAVPRDPIACARCNRPLDYVGRKRFHEGTNWGVLGELGELFVKREHFDVYVCPRCGRVEFFVDGIGEEYRPH